MGDPAEPLLSTTVFANKTLMTAAADHRQRVIAAMERNWIREQGKAERPNSDQQQQPQQRAIEPKEESDAMSGVNKVILVGNLGKDPEIKFLDGGQAVANFSLATNEKWKDKDGKPQDRTEWHRIVAWGKLAELCGKYLAKGKQTYVEGRLQTRSWDKDGQKHYATEIVAQNVTFLGQSEKQDQGDDPGSR